MRWRLLLTPPLPGALNMAIDEALVARARTTGEGVARVYTWDKPTISLGRNQRARGAWDPNRGLPIVRRLTGGRAVLHAREITYSITTPTGDEPGLGPLYRDINEVLLLSLRALGVDASLAPYRGRMPLPGSAPCFELPAPGEIMVDERKLVGSAQVREEGAALQHGSILVHDDQSMLQVAALHPVPLGQAASLATILGRPVTAGEFATPFFTAVRERWDADATALEFTSLQPAIEAAHPRYVGEEWTWRR